MALVLWFAGLIGLVVAAAVASGRGRAAASDVIGRGVAAIAAVAYAALVVSAIWLWGGQTATDGRVDRLREGASVVLTVDGTRDPLGQAPRTWTIGHASDASIRLPGDGPDVMARVAIDRAGQATISIDVDDHERPGHVSIDRADQSPGGDADERGASSSGRARVGKQPVALWPIGVTAIGAPVPRACRDGSPAAFDLPAGARVVVFACDGDRETRATMVQRDATHLIVTPLAIARGRLAVEQRALHAGDAIRIGSSADALPNLVTWELPAPGASAAMLAIPLDPTDCAAWGKARAIDGGCAVEVGAFSLAAIPFVPDADGVIARDAWVALLAGTPGLLALLVFAASPRRGRGARAFGRVLRLCVLGSGLVALGCWRLLWAHRIDMADPGPRVDNNVLAAIAIGAALAGNAVLSLDALDGRSWLRRAACALLGWAAWLVASVLVTGVHPPVTVVTVGVVGLSAIAAIALVLGELGGRLRAPPEVGLLAVAAAAMIAKTTGMRGALVKLGLAYATVLLGHAALRALLAPRPREERTTTGEASRDPVTATDARSEKSFQARSPTEGEQLTSTDKSFEVRSSNSAADSEGERPTSTDRSFEGPTSPDESFELPIAHWRLALGRAMHPSGALGDVLRRAFVLGSLLAAAGALAALDAGVTLAIAGVGLALAMLVAGHDAMYDASHAGRLGMLEREHARLLSAHGLAVAGLAIGVGTCAVLASDRELLASGAIAMLHAPLVAAGLFALAALIARTHRRSWAPWLAAALAAVAVWGMRDAILERAMAGDGVASRRVAAVVEPGYALLRDDHAFVANASAWREASTAATAGVSAWQGQGYFGATIRDPGVARSIDNDYLAVLVARETGVAGLLQGVLLLLALVVGAGTIASARLPHASREQRARWLVTGVAGVLAVYQPLAALGILPLTGLTWPGLGIDSPGELWLFVIGAVWCLQGAEPALGTVMRADERVRRAPRLARARKIVLVALVACGIAAVALVVRAGVCALSRANEDDERVTAALSYASSLACVAPDQAASFEDALPAVVAGKPVDDATARYERELLATWRDQRAVLARAFTAANTVTRAPNDDDASGSDPWLDAPSKQKTKTSGTKQGTDPNSSKQGSSSDSVVGRLVKLFGLEPERGGLRCPPKAAGWRIERDGDGCAATLSIGWPEVKLAVRATDTGIHASCAIALPDDAVSLLRTKTRAPRQRIRVVSAPIGASADDLGELVLGDRVVRLREGAPRLELAAAQPGVSIASEIAIGATTLAVRTSPRGVVLRGEAELFVADAERGAAWRRWDHGNEVVLDRMTLIAAGERASLVVAQFRPPRAWPGAPAAIDSLLADSAGDRVHRIYPHGPQVPELGWVNPYDVERSLGLDGWVHAYAAEATHGKIACGTLDPPAIELQRVCTTNPLDGVLECRVAIQPQLTRSLRAVAERIMTDPKPVTGRDVAPVRVGFVALRGDTGEILAQGNLAAGRPLLAYAPSDARAEAELVKLRNQRGEALAEKVEWNLPIAVGSTFKPIVARAAEQAFPKEIRALSLTAAGHAEGCRRRRGSIDPIAGHCPPTSVAGQPTTADVHDFLARSPNWFQAALGLIGLGLPDATLMVKDREVTFAEVVGSDLASWPADSALAISDTQGPIVSRRGVTIVGLRRTALWTRVEGLLGRPLCTLGDRASCERAAARADVCAARALPVASPGADLRNLVALGPDRIDLYPGDKRGQTTVPVRDYLQLLRGSGVHAVGSLLQITDAFGRVVYDPKPGASQLAASWFPAPAVGTVPSWSCASGGRENTVLGAGGGLCGVVQPGGSAHAGVRELLADPKLVIYGAKTGTIDSLADIARSPRACARWNASHVAAAKLECGRAPPDDSLLVIAFGVVTPKGTIPITLGIQLQRAGKSAATKAAPVFVQTIARYLR